MDTYLSTKNIRQDLTLAKLSPSQSEKSGGFELISHELKLVGTFESLAYFHYFVNSSELDIKVTHADYNVEKNRNETKLFCTYYLQSVRKI